MTKYSVRPYFGYDCDSVSGFNNGHYLDPIEVDADSPEQASERAMILYAGDHGVKLGYDPKADVTKWHEGGELGDLYREFDHCDDAGDTVLPGHEGCHYLYQYIDFGADVSEVADE